jgi:hypothetical protein
MHTLLNSPTQLHKRPFDIHSMEFNMFKLYNTSTKWQPENDTVQPLKKKHTQKCVNTGIGFIKGLRGPSVSCRQPRNTSRALVRRIPQTSAAARR